jgi:hypothetical protein
VKVGLRLRYNKKYQIHYTGVGSRRIMQQEREGMQENVMAGGAGTMAGGAAGATAGAAASGIVGWGVGMVGGALIGLVAGVFLGLAIARSNQAHEHT